MRIKTTIILRNIFLQFKKVQLFVLIARWFHVKIDIFSQLSAVLNFLCSVPGPSGEPALHFVMIEWVSRQHVFYGSYEKKVSIMALAKILQHGVNSNDTRLQVYQITIFISIYCYFYFFSK